METQIEEESVVKPEDLAMAMDGPFLDKMKEIAWRGKEAKLSEVPNEDMHSFQIWVGFNFEANASDADPLTFAKLGQYRFNCTPVTKEDVDKALEAQKQDAGDETVEEEKE